MKFELASLSRSSLPRAELSRPQAKMDDIARVLYCLDKERKLPTSALALTQANRARPIQPSS